jgi:DNA-binding transcriptional regulator/RsmH inhibitor MraZ
MNEFYGEEKCLIDANGRVKICPRFLELFRAMGDKVVLHCLPEGALAVYPQQAWQQMRQFEPRPAARAATSLLHRRQMRRFGALTQIERLSNQGRLTIPNLFRDRLNLGPGAEACMVGCEIGIEIWNAGAWLVEAERVTEHELERGEAEMLADLRSGAEKPSRKE